MEPSLFANMARTEDEHWWFLGRRAIALAVLDAAHLPSNAHILDVGAGTGGTTRALSRYGRVEALEIDPVALVHLRTRAIDAVHTAPLPDPGLPSASFDLITAFDVLEHLPDDRAVLADIHRLLRPGGRFLATVPAHPSLWTAHDDHHHHQRRYTRTALRSLLEGAGLRVSLLSPWMTLLFPLFLADRARQRLRPPVDAHVHLPHPLVNRALTALLAAEGRRIASGRVSPVGASWIALAERS